MEPTNLDNLHMLNSHISAWIDSCQFSHLENVWQMDSRAKIFIARDQANFDDYYLSYSKRIILTDGGQVEIKRYGPVPIDWIMQNRDQVLIVHSKGLHIPGIITNLISLSKLDRKGIYCQSDNQSLCVIKIYK